ncbi:MAG: translation initiation factor IF-2 [Bacteroidales bacterium]|jgi:translation initiation factor IF-2|nr:translation initiation factor IF-2 [Bacteroidales bacterium]MDD4703637.1 translation initiation factor IF-2 [Bacteroidales bacterium]MDX9797676.1 translation initiation factor IF-2 [Bacteroidales bacterium]
MSEENKTTRLSKVAKEFNVGISTLVDCLAKKGKIIESNPNTKIDGELYDILASAFQSERKVKEDANKLDFATPKAKIEIEEVHAEIQNEPKHEETINPEIIIKTTTIDFIEPTPPKEEKEKKTTKVESVKAKVEPAVKEQKEEVSKKKDEKQEKKEEVPAPQTDETHSLNIVGKIDLNSINSKTKPAKKTKAQIAKEKEEKKKIEQENKENAKSVSKKAKEAPLEKKKEKKEEVEKPEIVEEKPIEIKEEVVKEELKIEEVIEDSPEENKDNFIETQYVKLSGPKVLNEKVDLSQFSRPKKQIVHASQQKNASVSDDLKKDKKKRRRIKQSQTQTKPTQTPATTPQDAQKGKIKKDDKKSKFTKTKKELKKVEINSEEIEKQIKETLARLSPIGKSKASKHRREKRQTISQQQQHEFEQEIENQKILKVTEFVTANELATMMDIPVTKIISSCMSLGMFVSINQRLDAEAIQLISEEFGFTTEFVSADVVEAIEETEEQDRTEDLVSRSPIVTVMGHVDHGKTSLLDYIRNANVIAGEAGGITQHIGAYEVKLSSGKRITFLDTPGHEAFTAMRARGAKITDIAIIVIACDDRVMPQTVEAINHAQAAGVPIIFALNKIDTNGADPEKIKGELANMNLLVEDWGGKFQSQEISAKKGINIDLLLEKVLLEAELLDLKGNPKKRAKGTIIESSLDKGRGFVAKLLVQDGSINQGDFVLAGSTFGRVKAMYNERNQLIKEAGPSAPVLLLGLNGAPQAGDTFNVMSSEKEAKDLATRRTQLQREQGLRTQKHITLDEIGRRIAIGDFKQLDIIIKGDVDGSVEALADSLLKLSTPEVLVNVIHKSVGQITESDVLLATASNAIIIGFQVRPSLGARKLAEAEQIDIRLYSIIYSAINEIKDAIEGMLSPEIEEKIVANLEIKETFKISKVGTIAGCICLDGKINRNTKIRIIRDGIVTYTGKLASLKRFKDEVKEVVAGQDCGLNIENYNDIKVGDIVEGYEEIEIKRKL